MNMNPNDYQGRGHAPELPSFRDLIAAVVIVTLIALPFV